MAAIFLAYALTIFVPAFQVPSWVRFVMVCFMVGLGLLDRRGLTLKHLAAITGLCAAGSACLLVAAWHTQQAVLWGVLTAVLATLSLALSNVKSDPRVR
jgi:hypothetical protein